MFRPSFTALIGSKGSLGLGNSGAGLCRRLMLALPSCSRHLTSGDELETFGSGNSQVFREMSYATDVL